MHISRRTLLGYGITSGLSALMIPSRIPAAAIETPQAPQTGQGSNSFSRIKKQLMEGQSAVLLIISDSTGYIEKSGNRRFIRWLASQFPTHRVTESVWAEWTSRGATGPQEYGEELVIAEGSTKATLTIYNAVLPGAFAQGMIDGARWNKMIDPLSSPPDLILWNHGHNHQAGIPLNNFAYGRGGFYAPLGRISVQFPNSPQAAIIQNPWRDNDGYQRVLEWWKAVSAGIPTLTLVDGYSPFIEKNKAPEFYKDNVHPNDLGYELIFKQLVATWESTRPGESGPTTSWISSRTESLIQNGDLAEWADDAPAHWKAINGATVKKDFEHTFGTSKYSLALSGTKINDGLQIELPKPTLAQLRGKAISIALLCYVPRAAEQDLQVKFTTSSSDQVTGTIQNARDNWKWIVLAGCLVPAEAQFATVGIYRSFSKVPTDVPFYIQKLVVVPGDVPSGGL